MNVQYPEAPKTTIIPEAIVNLYQAVNSITRIIRKTAENTEAVCDLGFEVMQLTLIEQKHQLQQRQQMLTIA